ncbi:MAG: glucose-1-phosphate adenylyltransferase [Oscillospiraceae bacterium]|nr:glucose-1-phosphate adenylyltransferase [Oscillospiraceae bacterium]
MINECVVLVLAGGRGQRLGCLTKYDAKPAVAFGGNYRIIDFSLTNCFHSGLTKIGVVTQYEPRLLNEHVLKSSIGDVSLLPPRAVSETCEFYKGTANAVFQNSDFIEKSGAKYVVVLSGDHIYKMNYEPMIKQHIETGAIATIAVMPVPIEEAHRFGIMRTNNKNQVIEFAEKPKEPKSNLASMGVYVFSWEALKKQLIKDENNEASDHDFGKNVLPQILAGGEPLYAYEFNGYWKDVGTIESLWRANMDLISENPELILKDPAWRLLTHNEYLPPQYVGKSASISRTFIANGCNVNGTITNSILCEGATIEEGASISNSVIMPGAFIGKNTQIERCIIGENSRVGANCRIGVSAPVALQLHSDLCTNDITVVAPKVSICAGTVVGKNCAVESDISSFVLDIDFKGENIAESVLAHG